MKASIVDLVEVLLSSTGHSREVNTKGLSISFSLHFSHEDIRMTLPAVIRHHKEGLDSVVPLHTIEFDDLEKGRERVKMKIMERVDSIFDDAAKELQPFHIR